MMAALRFSSEGMEDVLSLIRDRVMVWEHGVCMNMGEVAFRG